MKITLATVCFVVGTMMAPIVAHSADIAAEGKHAMTYVKDSIITTKVKAKLGEEKIASLVHVTVNTDAKGVVFLSGNVKTQHDADKAVSLVRAIKTIKSAFPPLVMNIFRPLIV